MPDALTPEQRRLRRELLRRHHPDLGGDPEQFIQVLEAFQPGRVGPGAGDDVRFVRRPRGLARVPAWYQARRRRRSRPRRVV